MELVFKGLWREGLRHGAKDVGQTIVVKCLAPFGSLGRCAFAHSLHALGMSQRSMDPHGELFFFPSEERADDPQ